MLTFARKFSTMKKYIIAFDLGTAHIGCVIFEDGVVYKSFQYSYKDVIADMKNCVTTCGERRMKRSSRRQYDHLRRRKVRLLTFLNENGYLNIPKDVLKRLMSDWRNNKIAPENVIKTIVTLNPYADRTRLISEQLDMTQQDNKMCFARAMYSILNHRGFAEEHGIQLIDEDEEEQQSETGVIRKAISKLSEQMGAEGMRTVGEFMNKHLTSRETIRHTYQYSRKQLRDEFNMICDMQRISKKKRIELFHIMFDEHTSQRKPVRKKCPFINKNASVTYTSHPAFEEYRMWQFIRNIYVIDGNDSRRPLTDDEVSKVLKLFMRRSDDFDFSDIRNALHVEHCNYPDDTNVKACAFTVSLSKMLGLKNASEVKEYLSNVLQMNPDDALNEVWEVCFNAERTGKSVEYFSHKLHCDNFDMGKIKFATTTANLSAKACRMITKWMRDERLKMPYAVRMVNMRRLITSHINSYEADEVTDAKIEKVINALRNYTSYEVNGTLNEYITDVLNTMALDKKVTLKEVNETLWNHTVVNQYQVDTDSNGNHLLPVMHEYFSNPQIDKASSFIRRIINMLIKNEVIDPDDTTIVIESGRCDHSIVGRKAITIINAENKKLRDEAIAFAKKCGISNPTDDQIERYILWNEQNGISLWSGKSINKKHIFSLDYQIDHTEPKTCKGPNLLFNKTLCETSINQSKLNTMPGNMTNIDDVRQRVESLYRPMIDELESKIKKLKKKINTTNVESMKNEYRVRRIISEYRLDYYKNKVATFDAVTPRSEFSTAHGNINDVITRCMRNWLKCVFRDVSFIRAADVADARSKWHLNKNRDDNCNHVQDAFVLGCLKLYGVPEEGVLPYGRFSEDLNIVNRSLSYNETRKSPTRLMKKPNGAGYSRSLSKETKYALITVNGKQCMAVRKPVNENLDVNNIVDERIKKLFENVKKSDYSNIIGYNGKPLRSVRVVVGSLRPDTALKIKRKNSLSKKEKNNYIYYSPEGCACMGYYEDGSTHKLSVADEMSGARLLDVHPKTGSKLKYVIRLGDTVILMKNDEIEADIQKMPMKELSKRIFNVCSLGYSDKRNVFIRHDCPSLSNCNKESNIELLGNEDARCFRLTNVRLIKDNEIVMKLLFKKKNAV